MWLIPTLPHQATDEICVLSGDRDFSQLLKYSGVYIDDRVNGQARFTADKFVAKHGFQPGLYADYLALVGDAADQIPGVPVRRSAFDRDQLSLIVLLQQGIGEKTAAALVAQYGTLENMAAVPQPTGPLLSVGGQAVSY